MKQILLFLLLSILVLSCNDPVSTKNNKEIEEALADLDGLTLEEIKEKTTKEIKMYESFIDFFGKISFTKKTVNKEDERLDKPFKIDTANVSKALNQFKNVTFNQSFEDYNSIINFDLGSEEVELSKNISIEYIPQKIYYANGSVKTDSIQHLEIDFDFSSTWDKTNPIDSIAILCKQKYVTDFDVVEVSLDNPIATYNNGEIRLVEAEGNFAYITLSDTISSPIKVEGLNKEGKVINRSGYLNLNTTPKEGKSIFTEMFSFTKKVEQKLNADEFKTVEEFKEYLQNKLPRLKFFNDTDGIYHKQLYYSGNVNSIKVYYEKKSTEKSSQFVAKNTESYKDSTKWYKMMTDNGIIFLDNKGQKIGKLNVEYDLEELGNNYYEDSKYFYHLNKSEEKLDTVLVFAINTFKNGLSAVKLNYDYDDYLIYDKNNKQASKNKYFTLRETFGSLFGERNNSYFLINSKAEEKLLKGVDQMYTGDAQEDRIPVSNKQGKFGFINAAGKQVIPFKYNEVKEFEDGFTSVKYNGTYKIIDKNGKVIVDTEEDYINFSFGKDDNDKRIYVFRNKKYNYKGELIND